MSPEQARGKAVDKRTDIWAFGCVLYEMLTGRRAFPGETSSDAIAAILEREPDWTALPAATPPAVCRLLQRCLEKDPKHRLRDIGDVRFELSDSAAAPSLAPIPRGRPLVPWFVASLAVLAAVALAIRSRSTGPAPAGDFAIELFTLDPGVTAKPSLSSDGRLLAYASNRSGRADLDIWVQQTAGGPPLRITDDEADDTDPNLSADGSRIVFRSERMGGGVYLAPALGGPARLIARDGRRPRFSPDGTRMAYWSGQFRGHPSGTASAVYVLSLSGGSPVQLLQGFIVARDPVWAPDGRSLLVLGRKDRTSAIAETYDWWFVPVDGGPPARTTILDQSGWRDSEESETLTVNAWDASGLLVTIGGSIWSLPMSLTSGRPSGPARRLAFGAGLYTGATMGPDGRVVFADATRERAVQRARLTSVEPSVTLYTDSRSIPARASETRDGSTIVFERESGRSREIWKKDLRTGAQQFVLIVDSNDVLNPTVSSDGSRIGYTVANLEPRSVTVSGSGYVVETSGGTPRQLCTGCGVYEFLSDNRRAVVSVGDTAIRLIDVVTGSVKELLSARDGRIDRPSVSPSDRWIAFRHTVGTTGKVFVTSALGDGSTPSAVRVDEPTTTGRPCGWSPDSRVLYLLLDTDGFRCLWGQRVDPASGRLVGTPFIVRHFHELDGVSTSLGNAITADGFTYESLISRANLWLLAPKTAR